MTIICDWLNKGYKKQIELLKRKLAERDASIKKWMEANQKLLEDIRDLKMKVAVLAQELADAQKLSVSYEKQIKELDEHVNRLEAKLRGRK